MLGVYAKRFNAVEINFYIRFHGRNAPQWHSGTMQKQFDHDYGDDELRVWSERHIPQMASRAKTGVIFFNNHVRARAPRNALLLTEQLAGQGLPAMPLNFKPRQK